MDMKNTAAVQKEITELMGGLQNSEQLVYIYIFVSSKPKKNEFKVLILITQMLKKPIYRQLTDYKVRVSPVARADDD